MPAIRATAAAQRDGYVRSLRILSIKLAYLGCGPRPQRAAVTAIEAQEAQGRALHSLGASPSHQHRRGEGMYRMRKIYFGEDYGRGL